MSKRLYPHGRVKYWYAYDIDDICAMYKDLGLHPQTVRAWSKQGLKAIDKGKPALIYGHELITFLKAQNSKNKCKTAFDQMFCMKCQDARPVYKGQITIKHKAGFMQLSGLCRTCKSTMNKSYKIDDLPEIRRTYHTVDVLELYDCENPASKTHLDDQTIIPLNESELGTHYGDLFG